jgi:hypothetical protein
MTRPSRRIARLAIYGFLLAMPALVHAAEPRITIAGTRVSRGDAVECPKLRGDDGKIYSVHYLPPAIAIGARLSVTGYFAKLVRCRGRVLYIEKLRPLGVP